MLVNYFFFPTVLILCVLFCVWVGFTTHDGLRNNPDVSRAVVMPLTIGITLGFSTCLFAGIAIGMRKLQGKEW